MHSLDFVQELANPAEDALAVQLRVVEGMELSSGRIKISLLHQNTLVLALLALFWVGSLGLIGFTFCWAGVAKPWRTPSVPMSWHGSARRVRVHVDGTQQGLAQPAV